MEHWPGHERPQISNDKSKSKGKHKEHRLDSSIWKWPHLEYGSIGSATLVRKDGRVRWSTLVDTSHNTRWLPLGKLDKVFPETRLPQVDIHEHSTRQRTEKGLQYLRAYFPDADFPGELLCNTLEADTRVMHRLRVFDPFLGNMLEIIPSHQVKKEHVVVFPMGKLGRELNISRLRPDRSGNMVFNSTGSPSFAFETPILQITSTVGPPQWISTPSSALLIRTHTSSSLLRLECSKVTRELDITRSDTGDIPVADSRILASGPDIVVVNRSGKVYKCNTHHSGKVMQFIGEHEASDDDVFWQLGVTGRSDECFLASCKTIKHIDLRSASSSTNVFSLDHPSTIVTSFESPMHDYVGRIVTTSDILWLDDRFRRRPLLSYKHYRSFDRTLRVLTANLNGASVSLLTSRRNGLVTMYDVNRGIDGLLHCNSRPSCLPHAGPMSTAYDGHALVESPSDSKFTFLRLCQRGCVYRQDIRVSHGEDQPGSAQKTVTHRWDEDVLELEKQAKELQTDFGPAGGRHFIEVNLRGAYEKMFAIEDDPQEGIDQNTLKDSLAQLPDVWQDIEATAENMLTTFDVISGVEDGEKHSSCTNFLASSNVNSEQDLEVMYGHPATLELSSLARWHYNIQDTSVPSLGSRSISCAALDEYLKEMNLVSGVGRHEVSVRRETQARKQLILDLALSTDVYSARPFAQVHSFAAGEGTPNTIARPMEKSYVAEPPEVMFGYFRPIRKSGANHYADKEENGGQDAGISSPLGVRLLLAEWELGTDPNDYTYRDPYGLVDTVAQPVPRYRRLSPAPQMTQKKQIPPQQPPLVVAAASQPPVVHTVERAFVAVQSQPVQHEYSQQSQAGFDAFSQEPMTSTQVLPGPFGGRPGAWGKKSTKKRIGGF